MESLKIIETIKTSNLAIEKKVKGEEEELTKITNGYTSDTGAGAGCSDDIGGATVDIVSLHRIVAQDNLNNKKEAAMIEATMKT